MIPSTALAWGGGMHSTLAAHGHDRMTARWKAAIDHGLLVYGSMGPDVWYILDDEFMSASCPIACGAEDGAMGNEGYNQYHPDYYYSFTRHLIVAANSLEAVSWALGYGSHVVTDNRGHKEYIIKRNPQGNGAIPFNRHTVFDSASAALAFNTEGLYGYPTRFTADRALFGYGDFDFLTSDNALQATGDRDPRTGMVVGITGRGDKRKAQWQWILDEAATGLSPEDAIRMGSQSQIGSVSEGLLAARYGITAYDISGRPFPIVIEDGAVGVSCATDWVSRLASDEGVGHPLACQINLASASGLAQWDDYVTPADETSEDLIVNRDKVSEWIRRISHDYNNGDVPLDDYHVFEIEGDVETGTSQAHLDTIEGEDYTFGQTLGQIVDGVLDRSVTDVTDWLLENPHVMGTVLQSLMGPLDKARFVDFGVPLRPRMAAWPDSLEYEGAAVALSPGAPGPFADFELAVDLRPEAENPAPDMVYPFYLAEIRLDPTTLHGAGRLGGNVGRGITLSSWKDDWGFGFALDLPSATLSNTSPETGQGVAMLFEGEGSERILRVRLDATDGGLSYYGKDPRAAALSLRLDLAVTDEALPPYDLLLDVTLQPYCEAPDLSNPGPPATSNAACPLDRPAGDADADSDVDTDSDADSDTDSGGGSSCAASDRGAGHVSLAMLLLLGLWVLRRRSVGDR